MMISLVEKIKDFHANLQREGTYVDVIQQSLLNKFDQFIVNYNMSRLDKTLHELISMLVHYTTIEKFGPLVLAGEASEAKSMGLDPRRGRRIRHHQLLLELQCSCYTNRQRGGPAQASERVPCDKAKDWLYYLLLGSIETWVDMKQQFLQRFFPASRAIHLRKEIYGIRQLNGESLYEYWERFKELVASYPHHQFTKSLLIQYFYEGLSRMDRRMVDAASRGALIDKTPYEAQHLISTMAENYKQYGYHTDRGAPRVNEVSTNHLVEKLSELTVFVHQMAAGQRQETIVCGICSNSGHPTDTCPSLQEGVMPNVNVVGGFPGQPQ
ncbi:UNVERIFIED_CONTAM: hypothetical protein Scaly_2424300 [Sesamum calycinum]|uniref:Retrotransposon gag domain-containing protein n=1 Tax=Sesamum calycinum TaxID=2727403 RepID=A0AAW2LZ34_9LAMI